VPFSTSIGFIEAAEARLATKLPEAFRRYLLQSNGGTVELLDLPWEVTCVQDSSDRERLRRTSVDIVHETSEARQWPGFPDRAVAIGQDGCGNYLLFLPRDLEPALRDELYVWWHEGSELERVADSFPDQSPRPNTSLERTREG